MKTSVQPGGRLALVSERKNSCKESEEERRPPRTIAMVRTDILLCSPFRPYHYSSLSALSPKPLDGQPADLLFCAGVVLFLKSGTHNSCIGSTSPGGHLVSVWACWGRGYGP